MCLHRLREQDCYVISNTAELYTNKIDLRTDPQPASRRVRYEVEYIMSHPVFPTQDHHTVSIQPKWLHWLHSYHGLEKQDGITVLLAAADYVVSCEGFDDVCHMNAFGVFFKQTTLN